MLRLITTLGLLAFAIGAFCGAGPITGSPISPFGVFFLFLAALTWFAWKPMARGLGREAGVWDAFGRNILGGNPHRTGSGGSRG